MQVLCSWRAKCPPLRRISLGLHACMGGRPHVTATGSRSFLALALFASTAVACHRAAAPTRAGRTLDSLTVAEAAVAALQAVPGHAGPYQVVTFQRDSAGVVVGLLRRGAVLRDGGLVHVSLQGVGVVRKVWP